MAEFDASPNTRASIFINLNAPQAQAREIAWEDFHRRYAPIIGGFARKLGAGSDVEDIVQDVLLGFYTCSPQFLYDRSKGRFRGYLKKCTVTAIQKARRKSPKHANIDEIDVESPLVEEMWNHVWDDELLRRALNEAKREFSADHTYRAFEMYAIMEMPVQQVAEELRVTPDVVYQAKTRVRKVVRAKLRALVEEYGA
jgi:RNA polymerase sigma factor (sigma-70 family)